MEFNEEKPRLCTVCCEAFTTQDALDKHVETEHRDEHFSEHFNYSQENKAPATTVNSGESSFQNVKSLVSLDVQAAKMVKKPYMCGFCLQGFTDVEKLQSHVTEHTPLEVLNDPGTDMDETDVKPLLCDICDEAFTNLNDFLHHKVTLCSGIPTTLTEPDTKPHICDLCHEVFTDEDSLVSHKQQHEFPEPEDRTTETGKIDKNSDLSNDSSSGCDVYSESSFQNQKLFLSTHNHENIFGREDLNRHLGEHSQTDTNMEVKDEGKRMKNERYNGEKRFHCDQCDKTFARRSSLTYHFKVHRGEKTFPCDQCDKKFTHRGDLNKHLQTHSGEKPFQCDQCGENVWT